MAPLPHIDDAERRRRLVARHHLDGSATSVTQVADAVVALHSSDPVTPVLAVTARAHELETKDVEAAVYGERSMWRLHAMRRTLWLASTEVASELLHGTAGRIAASERRRTHRWLAEDGVADPQELLDRLGAELRELLADGQPRATGWITAALPQLQLRIRGGSQSLGSRLLLLEAMDGRIVRTAPAGSWVSSTYAWTTTAAWFATRDLPTPALHTPDPGTALEPDVARRATLRRYLAAFGPVTEVDALWWTGWTKSDLRRALAGLDTCEVTLDGGGTGVVLADDLEPTSASDDPAVALLPGLDPTMMGWKNRGFYLGERGELGRWLFDRNGNAGPAVLVDGAVVGAWSTTPDGAVVHDADLHREAVDVAAAALTRRLAGRALRPRFPSPSSTSLAQQRDHPPSA